MNIFDLSKNSLPEQVQINKDAISDINTALDGKQDTLTASDINNFLEGSATVVVDLNEDETAVEVHLDADVVNKIDNSLQLPVATPVEQKLVGIDTNGAQNLVSIDTAITENSDNPVSSDAVFDGLATKQDELTTSSVSDGTLDTCIGFDTDGNLVKGTVSSGGATLVWSGSVIANNNTAIPFVSYLTTGKTCKVYGTYFSGMDDTLLVEFINNTQYTMLNAVVPSSISEGYYIATYMNLAASKFETPLALTLKSGTAISTNTLRFTITKVYEV